MSLWRNRPETYRPTVPAVPAAPVRAPEGARPPATGLGLLLALALAAATAGCHGEPAAAPPPAAVRAPLATAERIELPRSVAVWGTVTAKRTAALSSRVTAPVAAVHADTGDRVARGQLLVEIDPAAAAGQLAQARGGLGQAEAALALAERNHRRYQALADADAASALELDQARTELDRARSAVEQARGAVAAAGSVAAEARVVAPFAGRVVRREVEVGDLAVPGRPLLVIESEGGRRLALAVPEGAVAAAGLGLGAMVPVRLDARPDLGELAGTVVEMTPGADPAAHAYTVEIGLPEVDGAPAPSGTAGRGRIELPGAGREAVAVPAAAVLRRGGLEVVVVRDAGGRAQSRAVTVGETLAGGRVEVLSGLAGGESVLVGLGAPPPAGAPVEEVAAGEPADPAAGAAGSG
jgi:RND family efflux transporter MFP subunit